MSHSLHLLSQYDSEDDSDGQQEFCQDKTELQENDDELILHCVRQTVSSLINKVAKISDRVFDDKFVHFRYTYNQDEIDLLSTSSSTDSEIDPSDVTTSIQEILEEDCDEENGLPPRTPGELGMDDLPPIEQLAVTAPVEELCHLGRIASIFDRLVSVQSFKGQSALDLDSVLFLKDGSPLGSVFEVFGPVKEPRYLVRFNSKKEIEERNLAVDSPVYCAPTLGAPFTSYVFTTDLMKMKGSDASWKHNNEPPEDLREFSDDEEERLYKLKTKSKRKANCGNTPTVRRQAHYASPSTLRAPPNTPANMDRWSSPAPRGFQ